MQECIDVFEFWCETSPNNVVTVNHAFHEFSLNVTVRDIGNYQKPFTCFKLQNVHQQAKNYTNVFFSVLLNKS